MWLSSELELGPAAFWRRCDQQSYTHGAQANFSALETCGATTMLLKYMKIQCLTGKSVALRDCFTVKQSHHLPISSKLVIRVRSVHHYSPVQLILRQSTKLLL